ncbi:MAG: N4-gp56 family major capsid protein [Candidatus Micrarchaeia archaeon]|jgi:N4-gp56 family major capsid protein
MKIKLNLQLFADAGSLVSATGTYINAYTGATTAFDADNSLSIGMKTFWDTVMLVNARENLIFAQLGNKQSIPDNQGIIIEWSKWNTLPDADQLVEGVIPTGKKFGESYVTTTLTEHGLYVATTKKLEKHHNKPVILGATQEIGASLARSYEKLIRTALLEGTNTLYADAINLNSSNAYVSTPAARHLLSNAATTWSGITADMMAQVVTRFEAADAPTFDGMNYVGVIHPYIAKDIRDPAKNPQWQEAHKYAAVKELFTNELGEMNGIRFIKSTLAPIIRGADLSAAARTLTVTSYDAGTNTITLTETLTADDVTALSGRELIIGGLHFEVLSATTTTIVLDATSAAAAEAASNPPAGADVIYPGEGGAAGISIFPCLFFAKDAFNIVDPEGAGIETIIKTAEQVGGPLNQFSTIGGKFEAAAKIVYHDRLIRLECVSSYSATAAAN